MRTLLLAGCLLSLIALAPSSLAGEAPPAAPAPEAVAGAGAAEPIVTAPPAPAPAPTGPASSLAGACPADEPTLNFAQCGGFCTAEPSFEEYCVGYDCNDTLRIDQCYCVQNRWSCIWQEQCPEDRW